MAARVVDLAEARARRASAAAPRPPVRIVAEVSGDRIVFTFPHALEGLNLTLTQARFWRDNIDNLIATLEADEG